MCKFIFKLINVSSSISNAPRLLALRTNYCTIVFHEYLSLSDHKGLKLLILNENKTGINESRKYFDIHVNDMKKLL